MSKNKSANVNSEQLQAALAIIQASQANGATVSVPKAFHMPTEPPDVDAFVLSAIKNLRSAGYDGIHSVFSGFNQAFRQMYPTLNPIEETARMEREGKIAIRRANKGVYLLLASDVKARSASKAPAISAALQRILGGVK